MEPPGHEAAAAFDIQAAALRAGMFEGLTEADMAPTARLLEALAVKLKI